MRGTYFKSGLIPAARTLVGLAFVLLAACGGGGGGTSAPQSDSGTGGGSTSPPPSSTFDPPMIGDFYPAAAAVGETVQIDGLKFATTAGGNTVTINGAPATVVSASFGSLVVTVPAGATSGRIRVTTSGGSSSLQRDFGVLTGSTPGVAWTTRHNGPDMGTYSGLGDIAWNGTTYVAIGEGISTSTDLVRWTVRDAFANMNAVIWDGSQFVAVGSFNISRSPDGLTWTDATVPGSANLNDVARSPERLVAVGTWGKILTSDDNGATWAPQQAPTNSNLTSVAWSGSTFVAVTDEGKVLTSADGIAWTMHAPGATWITALGAHGAALVAFDNNGTAYVSSDSGQQWTSYANAGVDPHSSLHYQDNQWVAVSMYNTATSIDGRTWIAAPAQAYQGFRGERAIRTGTGYVFAGSMGGDAAAVASSPDGISWTIRSSQIDLDAMARAPDGRIVAVGSDHTMVSTDGLHWEFGFNQSRKFHSVAWSPSLDAFVAVTQYSANYDIAISRDGKTWSMVDGYVPGAGTISASPSLLLIGQTYSNGDILTSADGATWTTRSNPTGQTLRQIFWTGSRFVGVGDAGAIVTSEDGATWTQRSSGTAEGLRGVNASPSMLVAVGNNGAIVTSVDGGISWTVRSGNGNFLERVVWTGAEFVAVGGIGDVVRSTDGVNWTTQANPYMRVPEMAEPFHLNDMVWTGSRLVVVGSEGLIATSP